MSEQMNTIMDVIFFAYIGEECLKGLDRSLLADPTGDAEIDLIDQCQTPVACTKQPFPDYSSRRSLTDSFPVLAVALRA